MLIAVDFSEPSRMALVWAFDYATRAPCEVHLVHVVENRVGEAFRGHQVDRVSKELAEVTREVDEELKRMLPDPDERAMLGRIVRHVAYGKPATEILAIAERLGADLIVIGTHGRGGLAQLVLGSVAEKVVRHAPCPVLVSKHGRAQPAASIGGPA
jgi:universal stress protein A